MTFLVNEFKPQTQIIAKTWRGETYDITGSLFSWSRTKTLSQAPGTFAIQLTAKRDSKGRTWADLLEAMDYIEIRASKNGKRISGELPVIMRGFLDTTPQSLSFGASGGPSEPRINLTGRDYTKLLLEWQILYLFTQNTAKKGGNAALLQAQAQGFGLFYNFHLPIMPVSITSFFEDAFAKLVHPIFDGFTQHYQFSDLPLFVGQFDYPDYPMSSMNVLSYTGSYWNLFEYLASPPFGELFVIDTQAAPTLIGRMTPYQTLAGETPYPGKALPVAADIIGVPSIDVQRSDTDVYTYFLTYGASTQITGLTIPAFVTGKGNGVQTKYADLYGVRPLELDTSWIAEYDANTPGKPNTSAIGIGSELNQWLIATQGENQFWYSGTVDCHGNEDYFIGAYVRDPVGKRIYYLSAIQDNYDYEGNRWDATLQVVRGRDEGA